MSAQILTANRLADGDVVYLTADGGWSTSVDAARIADGKEAAAALEAIGAKGAADQVVVAPYLIEVGEDAGHVVPLRFRERIRAYGPSNRADLAKHAKAG
jgi:sulfite reductase (NADPH) hemoprotein beta-component